MTIIAEAAKARPVGLRRWFCWVCLLLGCCVLGHPLPSVAQQSSDERVVSREYPLKALFLYNFGGYVEWPANTFSSAEEPFVIGVLGTSPVEVTLKEISATKRIGGRKIVVQRLTSLDSPPRCQILFIARDVTPQQQQAAISRLENSPVLIVGDSPGFVGRGGCVNFVVEANKIRFEINNNTAKQHQLKISAKLLGLAIIVSGG